MSGSSLGKDSASGGECPLGGDEDASLHALLPAEGPAVCGADIAPAQAHGEGTWAGHGQCRETQCLQPTPNAPE